MNPWLRAHPGALHRIRPEPRAESAKVPDRHRSPSRSRAGSPSCRRAGSAHWRILRRIIPEPVTGVYGTRYGPGRRAYRIPDHRAQDRTWRFRGVESRSRAGTFPESSRVPSRNRTLPAHPRSSRRVPVPFRAGSRLRASTWRVASREGARVPESRHRRPQSPVARFGGYPVSSRAEPFRAHRPGFSLAIESNDE